LSDFSRLLASNNQTDKPLLKAEALSRQKSKAPIKQQNKNVR